MIGQLKYYSVTNTCFVWGVNKRYIFCYDCWGKLEIEFWVSRKTPGSQMFAIAPLLEVVGVQVTATNLWPHPLYPLSQTPTPLILVPAQWPTPPPSWPTPCSKSTFSYIPTYLSLLLQTYIVHTLTHILSHDPPPLIKQRRVKTKVYSK